MAIQITKNQHIIPQRHLKQFSIPEDLNKVMGFNCDEISVIKKKQSIGSICSGYFFYALEAGKEDEYSQLIENAFKNIEDWYANNIKRIEGKLLNREKLDSNDRFAISCIVANFYFRGSRFRTNIRSGMKPAIDLLKPISTKNFHKEIQNSYPKFFVGSSNEKKLIENMVSNELEQELQNTSYATTRSFDVGFANTLTYKKWEIFINKSDYTFITSDEAVIDFVPAGSRGGYLNRAWLLKTQALNLSPKISITFLNPIDETEYGSTFFKDVSNSRDDIFKTLKGSGTFDLGERSYII